MRGGGRAALGGAVALFALYLVNVFLGAAQAGVLLGDVAEMLTLFGACVCFVIAILGLERGANAARENRQAVSKQGGET